MKPEIFGFLFAPLVIAACMIPGYVAALFIAAPSVVKINGLTYKSLVNQSDIK